MRAVLLIPLGVVFLLTVLNLVTRRYGRGTAGGTRSDNP